MAIYGWHYPNGQPISLCTPVRRWMRFDGIHWPFEKILNDRQQLDLLSDEGEIAVPRYDKQS